jgi:hypothetical protein
MTLARAQVGDAAIALPSPRSGSVSDAGFECGTPLILGTPANTSSAFELEARAALIQALAGHSAETDNAADAILPR